jgi:prevent-host-death family protein
MTVTIEEAKKNLDGLIAKAAQGESVVITSDQVPVARLVAEKPQVREPRVAGSAQGQLIILQEDDEHLKDFAEYME